MTREMICVSCPLGCMLNVELNDSIIIDSKNMYEGKVIE